MVGVDEVVVGVGEEGRSFQRASPLRCRVGVGGELRRLLRRRAKGGVVQRLEILPHRPRRGRRVQLLRRPLADRCRVLLVGVGADDAGVNGEALAADQALGDAARDHGLEQTAEQIALAEPAMAVLGEGRVVGDRVRQVEPAEME